MIFKLRDYSPRDFENLYQVDQQCFDPALAYSRPDLRNYLRLPGSDCVIAEAEDKIAGFLVSAHENGVGSIVTLDVLAAHRRQGVATLLLKECEHRLAAAGVHTIELETATDNTSAIAFWQKHDYRKRDVQKEYYPDGRDAFRMTKLVE
ncbi:MAG TPA: N-acetyltransferase [Candidatus Acidoferrales bacterium]|nr:N-acetyltransferase [Candidatus Acidoferrales bacterium]